MALSFKAPKTTGDYDLKVRYPGDAAYVGSRESDLVLHVVNNPKARAGSTEISLKGPAATILGQRRRGLHLDHDAPQRRLGGLHVAGPRGEQVVKTNGASALTFKTDQLHPGTYDVTAKFTYVDNGRAYEGTDSVSVTVDAQDSGKFDLWDSSASLGVRVDLNGTPSPVAVEAPKVSIVVGVPTLVRVAGLTPGVKWLVRVRESVKGKDTWADEGLRDAGRDGVTILPPLNAKVVGEGLVRLVPAAGDPVWTSCPDADPRRAATGGLERSGHPAEVCGPEAPQDPDGGGGREDPLRRQGAAGWPASSSGRWRSPRPISKQTSSRQCRTRTRS